MAKRRKPTPKTQKEISKSLQTPYDKTTTNPNNLISDEVNRGEQISVKGDTNKDFHVGLRDITESIKYYFDNVIKPVVVQNGNLTKVPVVYGSAERWKSFQKDGYYRDKKGAIMCPIIMFKLTNIEKNRRIGNKMDANMPRNYQLVRQTYNRRNQYDNFNVLNNRKPEASNVVVVIPDYVTLTYSCAINTYYIEQLDKLLEAINYASDSYWGEPERFKFQAMIDRFVPAVEVQSGQTRVVKSTFDIRLNGHIIPDTINAQLSKVKKINEKTRVIFTSETVADINDV